MDLNAMNFALVSTMMLMLFVMIQCDGSRSNMGKQNSIDEEKSFKEKKIIPLKSIKSPDGDIIDCINIYQQPAFDHPLLKNHTIQKDYLVNIAEPVSQLWQLKGSCPKGTIPVRRTKNEDLLRAKSTKKYGNKQASNFSQLSVPTNGHEHAIAYVQDGRYHGGKAIINVWQPYVQEPGEFSLAQIWVIAGPSSELNSVEAGWQVAPNFYGDNRPRLFIFWTSDGYQNHGCYNLLCSGFVQTSNQVALGGTLQPISAYHGPQYEISVAIWKDSAQNAWWVSYQNITFGYWPASLFTYLADSASAIQWGGEVFDTRSDGQHTTTQMGSGHFAEEGVRAASFFRYLQVVDESNNLVPPADDQIKTTIEQPGCYNLALFKNDVTGYFFLFGGPGRNPNCP